MKKVMKATNALSYLPSDEVIKMPLSMLTLDDKSNVRNVEPNYIESLAQSILQNGLKQNLVAIPPTEGENTLYPIVAGKRRFMALQFLASTGHISVDELVSIKIEPRESATVTSLTENFHREAMHPIDEFKAFAKLQDEGLSVLDISIKFGIEELRVKQRLALGSAAPELLEECLNGNMGLDQLKVLCQMEDRERQKELWFNTAEGWQRNASNLKKMIANEALAASDKLAKFVTLEIYEAEGGTLVRDLFSSDDDDILIADVELLKALAIKKLQALEKDYLADGWAWVCYEFDRDYNFDNKMHQIHQEQREMTGAEAEQYKAWETRLTEIKDILEDEELEEVDQEAYRGEYNMLEETMQDFDNSLDYWGEDKAIAGVYLSINSSGVINIQNGLVKPEDYKKTQAKDSHNADSESNADAQTDNQEDGLSISLKETLACVRAGAMQAELMKQPRIAMVLLCHALAAKIFYNQWASIGFFGISLSTHTSDLNTKIDNFDETISGKAIAEAHQAWVEQLPTSESDLLDSLLGFSDAAIQELMSYCTSRALLLHQVSRDSTERYRKLNALLGADVKNHWKPTSSTFFNRLKKPQIKVVLQQANISTESLNDGMKKGEMALKAEQLIQQNPDWLPELLVA